MSSDKVKLYNRLTLIVSFIVPTLVALLLFLKWNADKLIFDLRSPNFEPIVLLENLPFAEPLKFLPPIYATTNGITAILLIFAVIAIKNGNRKLHERLIKICIALSLLFLVLYIAYHIPHMICKAHDIIYYVTGAWGQGHYGTLCPGPGP